MAWERALDTVLRVAPPLFDGGERRCAVIGSAASALQGCRVSPRDLDLLAIRPEELARFAELMWAYTPKYCDHPTDHADWLSSHDKPLSIGPDDYGFEWHFGRWLVDGVKVEMAHISAPEGFPMSADGAGIWEAGPEIWPHVCKVPFGGRAVPVVPLEIQLETCLCRGLEDRAVEIISVLQRDGYDHKLIEKALRQERMAGFEAMMKGPVD